MYEKEVQVAYKIPMETPNNPTAILKNNTIQKEKNPKWLLDDYVKFIRFAESKIESQSSGIFAFISNNSFLDNPTFRGMRYHLMQSFDTLYILDLHGNTRKKETTLEGDKDENVFDIMQGVSINIFIKSKNSPLGSHSQDFVDFEAVITNKVTPTPKSKKNSQSTTASVALATDPHLQNARICEEKLNLTPCHSEVSAKESKVIANNEVTKQSNRMDCHENSYEFSKETLLRLFSQNDNKHCHSEVSAEESTKDISLSLNMTESNDTKSSKKTKKTEFTKILKDSSLATQVQNDAVEIHNDNGQSHSEGFSPKNLKTKDISSHCNDTPPCQIYHYDLYGKRKDKYNFLYDNTLDSITWNRLNPKPPFYLFIPQNESLREEYDKGFSVKDMFRISSVGVVGGRDKFVMSESDSQKSLQDFKNRIKKFLELDIESARKEFDLGQDSRDWKIEYAQKELKNTGNNPSNYVKIHYRPFDYRWTYYTGKSKGFHCMPRGEVMEHFLQDSVSLRESETTEAKQGNAAVSQSIQNLNGTIDCRDLQSKSRNDNGKSHHDGKSSKNLKETTRKDSKNKALLVARQSQFTDSNEFNNAFISGEITDLNFYRVCGTGVIPSTSKTQNLHTNISKRILKTQIHKTKSRANFLLNTTTQMRICFKVKSG